MIKLKDINKTYKGAQPLHVLKGIDLHIKKGEFVSIMGASGSGKSTLLNILGILDNYDTGEYLLNNVPIWGLSETKAAEYRNKMIGFIFQSFNLISSRQPLKTWNCHSSIKELAERNAISSHLSISTNSDFFPGQTTTLTRCREVRNREWQ